MGSRPSSSSPSVLRFPPPSSPSISGPAGPLHGAASAFNAVADFLTGGIGSVDVASMMNAGGGTKATTAAAAGMGGGAPFLRGRQLSGLVSKFLISPTRIWEILVVLLRGAARDWNDWLLIVCCIRAPLPLAYKWYKFRYRDYGLAEAPLKQKFLFSKTRKMAQLATEVGELFAVLFGTELVFLLLKELGFEFVLAYPVVHTWTAGIVASVWAAMKVSEFKRYILTRGDRKDLSKSNGTRLINRFFDIVIWVATALSILDFLHVKTGIAFRSLLGLSSVGTLVFSLSAQSLVSEFLASLAIQGTNMYTEGEVIVLGDGSQIKGEVQKLGWLNTLIRGNDEMVLRIPNTQIARTRIANLSRQRLSNVQVTLDISYSEMGKIKQLVGDIRANLLDTLDVYDTLITDGSRPFRVHWREVTDTSLQVVVDTHLRVKPFSDDYWNTRQEIFFAIGRAAEKNKINFSYRDRFRLRDKQAQDEKSSESSGTSDEEDMTMEESVKGDGEDYL
jgi:small-conductance mechanosensitive channel